MAVCFLLWSWHGKNKFTQHKPTGRGTLESSIRDHQPDHDVGLFAEYLLVTTVPLYALLFGGTEATAGAFMSIISLTALMVRPILGHLLDARSRRLIVALAITGFALAALLYGRMPSIIWILALAVLHGFGLSAMTTAAPTIYADVTPKARLAEGISLFGLAMNLTAAIGPVTALWLIRAYNHQAAFNAAVFLLLLSGSLLVLLNYEKHQPRGFEVPNLDLRNLLEKTALKPASYQLLLGFGAAIVFSFIPLYANARQISNISLFFMINAATGLVASWMIGRLSMTYGIRRLFVPGLILVMISFIILAFSRTLPWMLLAAALYGLGNSVAFALINIIGLQSAPKSRRGATSATLYAAMDIGVALGSLTIGLIAARFNFTVAFLVVAGVILGDLILFISLHRD
ncbi:MAG: MFS transporter [Clostridia bacterium]|nr:MFS transporter [Clostridia bacterium]